MEPSDPPYWPPADRQLTLTLDDVLIEDGQLAPFGISGPNFVAMGRFGNVLLINGETAFSGKAARQEVLRLLLVNTANTRIFNVALRNARMKLVGADSGRYERETFVTEVLVAPSERAIVDVLFDADGVARLEHRTPGRVYDLGSFSIVGTTKGDAASTFDVLRTDPELVEEHRLAARDRIWPPDKTLSFVASMTLLYGEDIPAAASYACPMHPEVTALEAGTCPRCGMTLAPAPTEPSAADFFACPMHPDVIATEEGTCPRCGMRLLRSAASMPPPEDPPPAEHGHGDGLEWEDLMPEINRPSNATNTIWSLVDQATGDVNHRISWTFVEGSKSRSNSSTRCVRTTDAPPFPHPRAGRFLILSRDGEPEPNLCWKDTVLVRAGETVDILLHLTDPGAMDGPLPHRRAHRVAG